MVVHGLNALCASLQQHISDHVELTASDRHDKADDDKHEDDTIPFVVDASAFLQHSFNTHFGDSLFGGEYASYTRFVIDSIAAWRAVGLHPIFVFEDAPAPDTIPTIVDNLSKKAAKLAAYMDSNAEARLSIPSQTSVGFMPPLLPSTLLEALRRTSVDVVLAPGDALPVLVTLARKLGGYAVSSTSVLFALNPAGGGYRGYVPLSSIAYVLQDGPDSATSQGTEPNTSDDPGPPPITQSYPPLYPTDPYAAASSLHVTSIKFAAYLPSKLAAHFELPPTLLPLIATLLNNDTSTSDEGKDALFFLRALQEEWKLRTSGSSGNTQDTRTNLQSHSSTGIISTAVCHLTSEDSPAAADMRALIESVMRRVVMFRRSSPTTAVPEPQQSAHTTGGAQQDGDQASPLVVSEGTPEWEVVLDKVMRGWQSTSALLQLEPDDVDNPDLSRFTAHLLPPKHHGGTAGGAEADLDEQGRERLAILRRYAKSFHALEFSPSLRQILFGRTYISPFTLEDPDETPAAADAPRHIRRWVYAILFGAYGFDWALETIEAGQSEEGRSGGGGASRAAPAVTELVRRGDHYVQELVTIPSLADMFAERPATQPKPLQDYTASDVGPRTIEGHIPPIPVRSPINGGFEWYVWNHVLRAGDWMDIIPYHLRPLAAALRFLVLSAAEGHARGEGGTRQANWSRRELEAAAYAGAVGIAMWQGGKLGVAMERNGGVYPGWYSGQWMRGNNTSSSAGDRSVWTQKATAVRSARAQARAKIAPPKVALSPTTPSKRAVHLSNTLQATLEATHMLSQSLLVAYSGSPPPSACHEGPLFHAYLAQGSSRGLYTDASIEYDVKEVLWAVLEDVDDDILGKDLEERDGLVKGEDEPSAEIEHEEHKAVDEEEDVATEIADLFA
ncbi:hypothetical protein OC835_004952 [Tilletia horrida]|nr:hypothetical protein OC835_004952 [Tilletia horrida]